MIEKNDETKNINSPELSIAMEVVQYIHAELEQFKTAVQEQINTAVNLNAGTSKRMSELEGKFESLKSGLERRNRERVHLERKQAEANLKIVREHEDKLDTGERLEVGKIAEAKVAELERLKKVEQQAFLLDLKRSIIKGVANAIAIPIALGLVVAIVVFLARVFQVQIP